jgi:flavin reductase (DIM6/NTAB) family NADH-FMN oxidoreductase RutF
LLTQTCDRFKNSYAVTLSSFTTVTLGPPTIVTFNLRRPSRTLDAILQTPGFRIHIIRGNELGRDIASIVAEGKHGEGLGHIKKHLENHPGSTRSTADTAPLQSLQNQQDSLAGSNDAAGAHNVPLITGDGVLAHLECRVVRSVEVGDHTVLFAEVLDIAKETSIPKNKLSEEASKELALLYYDRKYAPINTDHARSTTSK